MEQADNPVRKIEINMLNISKINYNSVLGKVLRLPLKLIPSETVVRILQGPLKGYKWVKGSSINGCWLGTYEMDKQVLFSKYIKEGMTVYDIGANVGFYSLLASHLTGKVGNVYSFEPLPQNLNYLNKHVQLNSLTNVEVFNKAVTNKAGILYFKIGSDSSQGRLSSEGELKVEAITIDEFVEQNHIPPSLIKMDIEGAEYDALLGAEKVLRKYEPIIFLATHGAEIQKNCINFLKNIGYKLSSISDKPLEESDEFLAEVM
jgi:FkbM family methyltransferase